MSKKDAMIPAREVRALYVSMCGAADTAARMAANLVRDYQKAREGRRRILEAAMVASTRDECARFFAAKLSALLREEEKKAGR